MYLDWRRSAHKTARNLVDWSVSFEPKSVRYFLHRHLPCTVLAYSIIMFISTPHWPMETSRH